MSLLKIKYSASSDLSHPDLSPLFGRFYKVFLDFLTSFLVLKINLCFHKFEPIPENIVHMKSFTDPICHISPDLSPKPDFSPLFFRRENVTNRRMDSMA